jgi:pimeloyl-ACP methyl ester carboxylesterase
MDVIDIKSVDPLFITKRLESCGKNILKNDFELLKKFGGFITFFHGTHDRYLQKQYLDELDLSLWRNQFIEFDSGHNIHKEPPEEFNYELYNFHKKDFTF